MEPVLFDQLKQIPVEKKKKIIVIRLLKKKITHLKFLYLLNSSRIKQ